MYHVIPMSRSVLENNKGHSPNLDTILMVEDVLSKKHEFSSKNKLRLALPKQLQYKTFNKILKYLEKSNKIAYDKDGSIFWTFAQGPQFERLEKESVKLK
jgi:predicted transcriptional regulator